MSVFTVPNIFVANTKIKSASVNANFAAIATTLNTNLLPAVGNTNALVTTDSGGNLRSVLPLGTEGQTLVVDPTATATGGLIFATPTAGISASQLDNVGLAVSASGGALTIALKQSDGVTDPTSGTGAAIIALRSPTASVGGYNSRQVITPLSMTLSLGTTLGMVANQNNSLWVYAIDTDGAGTMALGVSTLRVDDGQVQTVYPESSPVTISIASPAVFTMGTPPFSDNDGVELTTTGSLPSGLFGQQPYYVCNLSGSTFNLAIGAGGSPINTTGSQSGIQTIHVNNCQLVSNAMYSAAAVRLLGRAVFNLATPGTWTTPGIVEMYPMLTPTEVPSSYYSAANTGQTISATPTLISCQALISDTHGLVDELGQYIAPCSGSLTLTTFFTTDGAPASPVNAGDFIFVNYYNNGVAQGGVCGYTVPTNSFSQQIQYITGSIDLHVNKLDVITSRIFSSTPAAGQYSVSGANTTNSFVLNPTFL